MVGGGVGMGANHSIDGLIIVRFNTHSHAHSDFIERHNNNQNEAAASSSTYSMAHNRFSHLTFEEFQARVCLGCLVDVLEWLH